MRLLIDEMYPVAIAAALRGRGHDVTSVYEEPGGGAQDRDVVEFARRSDRAVLTENIRDFRPLAAEIVRAGESHAGMVYTTEGRWPRNDPGALIAALDALLASIDGQPVDAEIWL